MSFEEITASEDWLAQVAETACIRLKDSEKGRFASEIHDMLSALDRMEAPETNACCQNAVPEDSLRADVPGDCLPREMLLQSAGAREDCYFSVPRAIAERGHEA